MTNANRYLIINAKESKIKKKLLEKNDVPDTWKIENIVISNKNLRIKLI